MRYILCGFLLLFPACTFADNVFVAPENVNSLIDVADPEIERVYYGELAGFPHTYEIRATEPFVLHTQLLEPATKDVSNSFSVIVIRERDSGRGVETVTRLRASEASWDLVRVHSNRYFDGGTYTEEMQPGVYRVEVSTQVNQGKYALVLGAEKEKSGYFASIKDAYATKRFLEKSPLTLVAHPRIFVPVLLLLALVFAVRLIKKKYA